MIARRVIVIGRVQGVGFRWSAHREAERIGCLGWVRNRPDGTVEAHLQGPEAIVERMEAWFGRGPEAARVDGITATDVAPLGELVAFDVRR